MAQAIITKFMNPTATRDPRVKATGWNGSLTITWRDDLGVYGNHRAAAEELINKFNVKAGVEFEIVAGGELPDQSGYAFIVA